MLGSLVAWFSQSLAVARSRRQLATLDAKALADLGLTEADVAAECARPFWDSRVFGLRDHRRQIRRPVEGQARVIRN